MSQDLGARLVNAGLITASQLSLATDDGEPASGSGLIHQLVLHGLPEQVLIDFFETHGQGREIDPQQVYDLQSEASRLLPYELAKRHFALPIRREDAGVILAMADPTDEQALQDLRRALQVPLVPVLCRISVLARGLALAYPSSDADDLAKTIDRAHVSNAPKRTARASRRAAPPSSAPRTAVREAAAVRSDIAPPPPAPMAIEGLLEEIRKAPARDRVLERAIRAARTVARRALFLTCHPGFFEAWETADGRDGSLERGMWLPRSGPSLFSEAAAKSQDYCGPPGLSAVDLVFRAIAASQGGTLAIHPIMLRGRIVTLLCADGVAYGEFGRHRVQAVARATGEGLEAILAT